MTHCMHTRMEYNVACLSMMNCFVRSLQVNLYTFIHLYTNPSTTKMLQQFRKCCRASKWILELHVDQAANDFSTSILDSVSTAITSCIQQSGKTI